MGAAIRTWGLTKFYGRARGIEGVDLEVPAGEVFGFLGPNGAGKTTTIRLLVDHIRPTGGRAEVLGLDSRRDAVEIRRRIGMLPSDMALYPRLTGRQLLDHLRHLRRGADSTQVASLADQFALELDRPIRNLSTGNRQKIAVASAFMHRPELVILDEPTVGLDPLVQREFETLIREVTAQGRTVFLSSHSLSEVERVADRVGIIRAGELVEVARVRDLKQKAVRHLEFEFAAPVPPEPFGNLEQVRSVEADGSLLRITLTGPVGEAVKLAAHYELLNVVSEEPDLEELFLTYYRPGAGAVP